MENNPFRTITPNPRLSDQVQGQIEELILSGRLELGRRLPPERELAERFGVSRTVIREAVRSLVAKGLLDIRSGSGTYVRGPQAEAASDALSMLLRQSNKGYDEIQEVRSMIELEIARLAALRATPEQIGELRRNVQGLAQAEDSPERFAELDVAFHELLAQATQNPLIGVMLDSITEIMLEIRRRSFSLPGSVARAAAEHQAILERIAAHDPEGAVLRMREHLATSYRRMQGRAEE